YELTAERSRLRHAGRLLEVTSRVAARLDQGEAAICDELGRLGRELTAAAELDPALAEPARALEGCWSELSECAREVGRDAERIPADRGRLAEVEERLYRLTSLLRQHGPTLDDVIATRERLAKELAALATVESRVAELEQQKGRLLAVAAEQARRLSARR